MSMTKRKQDTETITRYADMFAAMGTDSRLRIMQLLLSAHPEGLVVGDIGNELEIPNSTLSHHLEKLKHEGLVEVRRRARSSGTPPTRARCKNSLGFYMRSAVPETTSWNPRRSCVANRRNYEHGH